jgi:GH25 family lysozyme M1 (1,4-beta-N-acetylmuramidase)
MKTLKTGDIITTLLLGILVLLLAQYCGPKPPAKNDSPDKKDSIAVLTAPLYGIDISKYQGNLVEELPLLDTIHFIICKATQGTSMIDHHFVRNWQLIRQKNYFRGAYHFYETKADPVQQAINFATTIRDLDTLDLPPVLDVEQGSLSGAISMGKFTGGLKAFLEAVETRLKRKPVIYTDLAFAEQYLSDTFFARYPLWIAEYGHRPTPGLPAVWKDQGQVIWQRSDHYDVHSTRTDFDQFNGNAEDMRRFIRSSKLSQ